MRGRRRWVATGVLVAGLAAAAVWCGYRYVPVSYLYLVETEFAEVPADDREFEAWLRTRPEVYKSSVHRTPAGGATRVEVLVGVSRNGWFGRRFPDLDGKCRELGYRGASGPFRPTEPSRP